MNHRFHSKLKIYLNNFIYSPCDMKKIFLILVVALMPYSVYAKGKNSPLYFALKGGLMDIGTGAGDSAINAGVDVGYQWGRYMSTEIEYTSSIVKGDTPSGNDFDITTFSAFAAFRSRTAIKFKAKAGLTDIDGGGLSDIEFSYGLGLGFWSGGGLMEIEYTVIDDGLDFISLGVNYFF